MTHINDAILAATGGSTVNEGLASWFVKTPDLSLQDAEKRWLFSKPIVLVEASIQDMWKVYLESLGYSGSLNDMKLSYWESFVNPVGPNLYPNHELVNGSDIIQDVPTGSLPDDHVLAFENSLPVNADYIDDGDGSFHYVFNTLQEVGRLSLQQTISGFEVGKVYRFQAKVKTTTAAPTGTSVRALHIAALVDMNLVAVGDSFTIENSDFVLRWLDFEVTVSNGRGNFRHGAGVFDPVTTMQETKDIAIYELDYVIPPVGDNQLVTSDGDIFLTSTGDNFIVSGA